MSRSHLSSTSLSPPAARPTIIIAFFVGTFMFTWSWWVLIALLSPTPSTALIVPGAWAPTLVAGLLIARTRGRAGLRAWFTQLRRWRVISNPER